MDKSGLWDIFLLGSEEGKKRDQNQGIGPSAREVDFKDLISHPDFEDHLERAVSMNRFALEQSLRLRGRILEILNLLDAELARI